MKTTIKKKKNFTTISNSILLDQTISFKAKGILIYMLSRPENWNFNAKEISKNSKDGLDSVYSGLKELVDSKYISRKKNSDGTIDYYIFEDKYENDVIDYLEPNSENPSQEKPSQEKPSQEKPNLEKPDVYKRKNTTKERIRVNKEYTKVIESYNQVASEYKLAKVDKLTNTRESHIKARIKEYGIDTVILAIDKIKESNFLQGQNKSNWKISFDWFINSSNFVKLMEDTYKNSYQIAGNEDSTILTDEDIKKTLESWGINNVAR